MASFALSDEIIERLSTMKGQEEFYDSGFKLGGSFGIRVSRHGTKAFFLIYPLHNKRKRITLGLYPVISLEQARQRACTALRRAEAGFDPAAEKQHRRNAETFRELAMLFLKHKGPTAYRPATLKEYKRIIDVELSPQWGDRKAEDISSSDIISLVEEISADRNSPVMANRTRSLVKILFEFGLSRRIIRHNPVKNITRVTSEAKRDRILSLEEIRLLWEALEPEPKVIQGIFKLLLLTGQKPGTVMQMKWSDIMVDKWVVLRSSDNKLLHQIHLSPLALETLRRAQGTSSPSAYVFSSSRGSPVTHIRKAAGRLNTRMRAKTRWCPSDLRRTAGFHMQELGLRPDVVEIILGRRLRQLAAQSQYDYAADIEAGLNQWARKIAELAAKKTLPDPSRKIVRLF